MIFLDTDLFVIDLRYRRDAKYTQNRLFLEKATASSLATTSIFNLLEVCGILSFNLNRQQLYELFRYLPQHYNLKLDFSLTPSQRLPLLTLGRMMEIISQKVSFGDSLIIYAVMQHSQPLTHFVSWNAKHYNSRLNIPALTPAEALATIQYF